MKRGALLTEWRALEPLKSGARMRTARLVSLRRRGIGLQLVQMEMDEGDIQIALEAGCDGLGVGLTPIVIEQDIAVWRTRQSDIGIAMACDACVHVDGIEIVPEAVRSLKWRWTWTTRAGQVVSFARLVSIARSQGSEPDVDERARAGSTLRGRWDGAA